MGLASFFFTIFAILGVSLWDGKIHYRCYETELPVNGVWKVIEDDIDLCSHDVHPCKKGFCGSRFVVHEQWLKDNNPSEEEQLAYIEAYGPIDQDSQIYSLNYGITSFDNIGSAFLTIFQCITMEGWTKIMNIFQDTYAEWFVQIYFILCVIICSFFLLNLPIAVMLMKFEEQDSSGTTSKHDEELLNIGKDIGLPQIQTGDFLVSSFFPKGVIVQMV